MGKTKSSARSSRGKAQAHESSHGAHQHDDDEQDPQHVIAALRAEVSHLRSELQKAKKYARLIAALDAEEDELGVEEHEEGDEEEEEEVDGHGAHGHGSSPHKAHLKGGGVSFHASTPHDHEHSRSAAASGSPRPRGSLAVVKEDPTLWEAFVESTTGDTYWFHRTLKVTVWEKPSCVAEAEELQGVEEQAPAPKGRLRSSSFVVRERAEEEHDASKWVERQDEHGVPMWYHTQLKTTTYKQPSVLSGRHSPILHAHAGAAADEEEGEEEEEGAEGDDVDTSLSDPDASEASSLPRARAEVWKRYVGKSAGEPYWQHQKTRQIVWTDPTKHGKHGKSSAHDGHDEHSHDDHGHDEEEESEEAKEAGHGHGHGRKSISMDDQNKPSNWKQLLDKASGHRYWLYLPTKATQWETPACLER